MKRDNKGFSLVELIISIVILAILIIPLFHHFITSTKINQQVAKLRSAEVTAINLLEGIKGKDLQSILSEFAVDDSNPLEISKFTLLPLFDGRNYYATGLLRLRPEDVTMVYDSNTEDIDINGIYVLSIIGLEIDGKPYDVLLHINCETYTAYNDYELPVLNQLDDEAVAMVNTMMKIDGKSLDEIALQEFSRRHQEHVQEVNRINEALQNEYNEQVANREAMILEGITPTPTVVPTPDYKELITYTNEEIEAAISKQTTVTTLSVGDSYRFVANAIYTVANSVKLKGNLEPESQTYQITLVDTLYKNPITDLYLFYTPTTYEQKREILQLHNCQSDTDSLNAYIMKQEVNVTGVTLPYCEIMKDSSSKPIKLYSNMRYGNDFCLSSGFTLEDVKGTIEHKEASDWIYKITIGIYEHENIPANRYQELKYEISSSGVEN